MGYLHLDFDVMYSAGNQKSYAHTKGLSNSKPRGLKSLRVLNCVDVTDSVSSTLH